MEELQKQFTTSTRVGVLPTPNTGENLLFMFFHVFARVSDAKGDIAQMVAWERAALKRSFYVFFSPPSAHPSAHKKLLLTLPLSDVRPPTWGQSYKVGSIL